MSWSIWKSVDGTETRLVGGNEEQFDVECRPMVKVVTREEELDYVEARKWYDEWLKNGG